MNKDICQFYIVVGDSSFMPPKDNNVYINATNIVDYKIIQDEIFRLYKEKAKQGITVGSEIIFLVGGISDSEKANEIISKLRLKGKIQVIGRTRPKEVIKKSEEIKPKEEIIKSEETKKEEKIIPPPPIRENFEISSKKEIVTKEEKLAFPDLEEVKQPSNVYRRDFETNNYSGYIGKPIEKKNKLGKLPLIIFIISLLIFVGSLILLLTK